MDGPRGSCTSADFYENCAGMYDGLGYQINEDAIAVGRLRSIVLQHWVSVILMPRNHIVCRGGKLLGCLT